MYRLNYTQVLFKCSSKSYSTVVKPPFSKSFSPIAKMNDSGFKKVVTDRRCQREEL